jgi:hypothetical protein
VKVSPEHLPLRLSRSFRPWSYTVSHRTLTLRSDGNEAAGETVYVRFLDVLAMQLRHRYPELLIATATDTDPIDRFVEIPDRHSDRYLRLTVTDGAHPGFGVAAVLDVSTGPPVP